MAHWMKHWPALVAVGCGLVALWLLPPDPPFRSRNYLPPTEAQALKLELRAEAGRLNNVLKRLRWLDSLGGLLADAQPDVNGVIVSFPEGIDDDTERKVREYVAGEIARLGIESTDYTFAIARPNARSGNHGEFRSASTVPEFYALKARDRQVCLALEPYAQASPRTGLGRFSWFLTPDASNILGPCAFYLVHGPPGPAIGTWLGDGGAKFATRYAESRPSFDELLGVTPSFWKAMGNQAPFGVRTYSAYKGTHLCLAGAEEICRDLVVGMERPSNGDFGGDVPALVHFNSRDTPFYTFEESLLYDLEQEFGREAFGRFWTSDQEVEPAFKASFGLEIGEWVMGWAQERMGVYHMGPMPSLEAILISLGMISFFLTIAIAMGTRRKVA